MYKRNFKTRYRFPSSTIFNHVALHVIVMAASAKKKTTLTLKTIRIKSFSDNFTVETDDEAQISSMHTHLTLKLT